MQLDLFAGGGAPAVDADFRTARRVALDATSWVEYVPGWLAGADVLFTELLAAAGWEQRDRWIAGERRTEPRLTATYPDLADAPHPMLATVAAALSDRYGTPYDGLWINLYRDHRDSTGWHGDRGRKPVCTVPVLSLGTARRFLIRPAGGGPSRAFTPHGGDLVVMGGRAQRDWVHAVPKQTAPAGPRISVNLSSSAQADRR